MEGAPQWTTKLHAALSKNRHLPYAKYFQLATIREDGRPANRTVVFRGFARAGDTFLKFVSDSRYEKIPQMRKCPWAEICWYFPDSREQFRIVGTLKAITNDEKSEDLRNELVDQWKGMSDNARMGFANPTPGKPIEDNDGSGGGQSRPDSAEGGDDGGGDGGDGQADSHDRPEIKRKYPNQAEPLDTFVLVIMDAEKVDYLLLKGDPQTRFISERLEDGNWNATYVNP